VSEQLALFEAPSPNGNAKQHGGSVGYGVTGLVKALMRRGLTEDAVPTAVALAALLDEDARAER
jgi:hypothetical protein